MDLNAWAGYVIKVSAASTIVFTAVSAGLKAIEDARNRKGIGNRIFSWFNRSGVLRKEMMSKIDSLTTTVEEVKKEVAINGGTKLLRDVVLESQGRHQENAKMLKEIMLMSRATYDLDTEMKFMMDVTGGFYQPNKSLLSFFGFSEQDLLNREWQRHISESDMNHVTPKLHWALKHKGVFETECTMVSNENEKYRCKITAIPMKNGDELLGFMGQIEIIEA